MKFRSEEEERERRKCGGTERKKGHDEATGAERDSKIAGNSERKGDGEGYTEMTERSRMGVREQARPCERERGRETKGEERTRARVRGIFHKKVGDGIRRYTAKRF